MTSSNALPWPTGLQLLPPIPENEPDEVQLVEIRRFEAPDSHIRGLAPLGPDRFVSNGPGVSLLIWSTEAAAPLAAITSQKDDPAPLDLDGARIDRDPISPAKIDDLVVLDSRTVITASSDWTIRSWNLETRRCVQTLRAGAYSALSPLTSDRFAVADAANGLMILAGKGARPIQTGLLDRCDWVLALAPDRLLATRQDEDDVFRLTSEGQLLAHQTFGADDLEIPNLFGACALSASRYVTAELDSERLFLWDIEQDAPLQIFSGEWDGDSLAALSPNRVARASYGFLDIWSVADGMLLARAEHPRWSSVITLPGASDGVARLVSKGENYLALWEVRPR